MGRQHSGRMVGREEELRSCLEVLGSVNRGESGTVLVLGEAGIGKTRLSEAVVGEVRQCGGVVLTAHGIDLDGGELPYGLVSELLRDLERQVGRERLTTLMSHGSQALASLVPGSETLGDPVDRVLVVAGVLSLLERLGDERMVCWWIEDLQWADQPSRDIIRYVSRVVTGRVLLLATVRTGHDGAPGPELDELLRSPGVETLRLSRLTSTDIHTLVRELRADQDMSVAELVRVAELSDGIPFFIEELARSPSELPRSLRALMAHRLDGLSESAQALATALAVGGGPASYATLSDLMADPDVGLDPAPGLSECLAAGVLEDTGDDDGIRFGHALVAEAVLVGMHPELRRTWHERWAILLDRERDCGRATPESTFARARHWYGAKDAARAVATAVEAARVARGGEAHAEEAHHWGHAHELWLAAGSAVDTLPVSHHDVVVEWLWSTYQSGETATLEERIGSIRRSPDFAGDQLVEDYLGQMELRRRVVLNLPQESALAEDDVAAVVDRVLALPPSVMAASTLHWLAYRVRIEGSVELSDQVYESVTTLVESSADLPLRVNHQMLLSARAFDRGDYQEALDRASAALELATSAGTTMSALAATDLCLKLWMLGRLPEALEVMEPILAGLPEGSVMLATYIGYFMINCAWILSQAGDLLRGEALARAVRGRPGAVEMDMGASEILACILARQGRLEEAQELVAEEAHTGAAILLDMLWANLTPRVDVAVLSGDRALTRELAAQLWSHPRAILRRAEVLGTLLTAARLLLDPTSAPIDPDDVAALKAAGLLLADDTPLVTAQAAEIAALVSDVNGTGDAEGWSGVVDNWLQLGQRYDETCARLRLAAHLVAENDPAEASVQLIEVQRVAEQLPSASLSDQALAAARVHGLRVPRARSAATSGSGPLTAREHEVLGLIAAGLSNPEIAKRLYMSPKTVSVHVSHIINKLGVRNRTEAATLAQRSGLIVAGVNEDAAEP